MTLWLCKLLADFRLFRRYTLKWSRKFLGVKCSC